jgi:hypothetical protein
MKKLHHKVVRFIFTRHINLCGWPTARAQAVWWLYEALVNERRRNLATQLKLTCEAARDWLAACRT